MRRAKYAPPVSPKRDRITFLFIIGLVVLLFLIRYLLELSVSTGAPATITEYVAASTIVEEDPQQAAQNVTPVKNPHSTLSVPTYVNYVDGTYFLVDCYHDQVLYHDNMTDPLTEWTVLTNDLNRAHTLVSDGQVYLVDDTENHRLLIFEKINEFFVLTQKFDNIGTRPHYIQYEERTGTFYVWSSMSGEMYLFRHTKDSTRMYLTEVRSIPELNGIYVRSFTISGNDIYFVSGNSSIIKADLSSFRIRETYPVPAEIAGMIQLLIADDTYFITVSTDLHGNQDYATMIQCDRLEDLQSGKYTDVYHHFVGGGTPYYITLINNTYYLTEHRIPGHSVWSFQIQDKAITDVKAIY